MLLDGVRELREHSLAADLEFVVPHAHKYLCLEGVRENVRVALDLRQGRQGVVRADQSTLGEPSRPFSGHHARSVLGNDTAMPGTNPF